MVYLITNYSLYPFAFIVMTFLSLFQPHTTAHGYTLSTFLVFLFDDILSLLTAWFRRCTGRLIIHSLPHTSEFTSFKAKVQHRFRKGTTGGVSKVRQSTWEEIYSFVRGWGWVWRCDKLSLKLCMQRK